jgi:hypothetical protein
LLLTGGWRVPGAMRLSNLDVTTCQEIYVENTIDVKPGLGASSHHFIFFRFINH